MVDTSEILEERKVMSEGIPFSPHSEKHLHPNPFSSSSHLCITNLIIIFCFQRPPPLPGQVSPTLTN